MSHSLRRPLSSAMTQYATVLQRRCTVLFGTSFSTYRRHQSPSTTTPVAVLLPARLINSQLWLLPDDRNRYPTGCVSSLPLPFSLTVGLSGLMDEPWLVCPTQSHRGTHVLDAPRSDVLPVTTSSLLDAQPSTPTRAGAAGETTTHLSMPSVSVWTTEQGGRCGP